jgi:hypothetical protein
MAKGFLLVDGSIRDPVQDPVDRISVPSSVYSGQDHREARTDSYLLLDFLPVVWERKIKH